MEHWKKVHNKHCKYLAKKKSSPVENHNENCKKCVVEEESFEDIKQFDNPLYPCHIKHSYKKDTNDVKEDEKPVEDRVQDCIGLGELSGQFISKMDKNISILQHISVKLHRVYPHDIDHEFFGSMVAALLTLRNNVRFTSLIFSNEVQIDVNACKLLDSEYRENIGLPEKQDVWEFLFQSVIVYQEFNRIYDDYGDHDDNEDDALAPGADGDDYDSDVYDDDTDDDEVKVYKWWSSFIFFLNLYFEASFFYKFIFDIQFIKNKKIKDSTLLRVKEVVSQNNFMDIWTKLLDACTEKMVPFNDLLQIYCGEKLERECSVCSDRISVSTFSPTFLIKEIIALNSSKGINLDYKDLIVTQNHVDRWPKQNFICRKLSCRKENESASKELKMNVVFTSSYLKSRFQQNRCDFCHLLSFKVHRCSICMTKVYCSKECQEVDWKVHKLCCEQLSTSSFHQDTKKKESSVDRDLTGFKNVTKMRKAIQDLEKELKNELTEVD